MTILVRTKSRPFEVTEVTPGELLDLQRWNLILTEYTNLYSNWFVYESGPSVDVESLTITITKVGQGSPIVGPTSAGITNVGTGNYQYLWSEDDRDGAGDYFIQWDAIDGAGEAVQATETITLA
jgi:hypothetical protein